MCADFYTGIKDIFIKRDEVMKIQDEEIEEATRTKERIFIEEEIKAFTALIFLSLLFRIQYA